MAPPLLSMEIAISMAAFSGNFHPLVPSDAKYANSFAISPVCQ